MSSGRTLASKAARVSAWLVIPILVVASIWLPVVQHYHVQDPEIGLAVVEKARWDPPQSLLDGLRGERLLQHGWGTGPQIVAAAGDLLHGSLRLGGSESANYRLPFHPGNLTAGDSWLQLLVAGLVPVDLLLQAYEQTGNERFFSAARAMLVEFDRYERSIWLPKGLIWNDHAIANRVFVLSDFWRVYRHRPDFDPETARVILHLAARGGEFLAAPRQYTFATNHGVMQNVALLRLRLSFPSLPKSEYYARLGMERLTEQMGYYVTEGGVVLEHSAGYQFFGIELMTLAFRYVRLLHLPVPKAWDGRLTRAFQFAAQLRRPDGTLPVYGDTSWTSRIPEFAPARPGRPITLDPVAGYAVWWDGLEHWPGSRRLRQTVVAFSYFPGHGHKHSDELSVLLWAGGQTWWTNVGSWPYDRPERALAESWNGSNAPHLIDEAANSQRTLHALAYGSSAKTLLLEVEREGPGDYRVRRQVLHIRPNVWLVIDAVSGAPMRTSVTRWITGYGIVLQDGETEGHYVLEAQNGPARLYASFFGSPGMTLQTLPRTLGPFRGSLEAREGMVPGIEVTQAGNGSWSAVAWAFDEDGTMAVSAGFPPKIVAWRGPEHWSALLPGNPARVEVSREGDLLSVGSPGRSEETIHLGRVDVSLRREEIRLAFARAAGKYPGFRERLRYRRWSTYALVVAMGVQELLLVTLGRRSKRVYRRLRFTTLALWIVGGIAIAAALRL